MRTGRSAQYPSHTTEIHAHNYCIVRGGLTQGFPQPGEFPGTYITGGHIWVALCTVEPQEVACAVHDAQCHSDLVRVLAVDGQLDVTSHSQSVVHTQHPLVDVHCSLLEVESLEEKGGERKKGGDRKGRRKWGKGWREGEGEGRGEGGEGKGRERGKGGRGEREGGEGKGRGK